MKKNKLKRISPALKSIYPILILIVCFIMGIGYATLNTVSLQITGQGVALLQEGVFITEVNYSTSKGADIVNSNINSASGTVLNSTVVLSETDSTSYITYSVKLLNTYNCNAYYIGTAFDNAFYDNSNITFELSSNLVIGMMLAPGESIEFDITFKYKNGLSPSSNINKLNSYISFNFSTLPSDYTLLEYIEGTGSQWIDTGFAAPDGFIAEMEFEYTVPEHTYLLGAHDLTEPYGRNYLEISVSAGRTVFDFGLGDSALFTNDQLTMFTPYNVKFSTIKGNSYLIVDGERVLTSTDSSTRSSSNLYLLTNEYALADNSINCAKIYFLRIYDKNEVLTRFFIPCLSPSREVGLYDLVTNQFYGNSGTGEFLANLPSGYQKINYIEGTGTQWIDTGFVASEGYIVDIDYELSSLNDMYIFGSHDLGEPYGRNYIKIGYESQWVVGTGDADLRSGFYPSIDQKYNIYASTVKGDSYIYVDGTRVASSGDTSIRASSNVYIFSNYFIIDGNGKAATGKLYHVTLYSNDGTLVRNYIPCISPSGEVGVYDLVTNQFYGNSGTGEFLFGLPSGYQELNYIESTGTQYIDTGYSSSEGFTADSVVMFTGNQVVGNYIVGSHYEGAPYGRNGIGLNGINMWEVGTGDNYTPASFGPSLNVKYNVSGSTLKGNNYIAVDGTIVSSNTDTTSRCHYNLWVFQNQYSISMGISSAVMRLYLLKIYDNNGNLVRDFVPVINNKGEVGLFDFVTKQFYGNEGTGEFIAG